MNIKDDEILKFLPQAITNGPISNIKVRSRDGTASKLSRISKTNYDQTTKLARETPVIHRDTAPMIHRDTPATGIPPYMGNLGGYT